MSTPEHYRAEACVRGAMVKDTVTGEVVCICPINRADSDLALRRAIFFAKCINEQLAKRGGKS